MGERTPALPHNPQHSPFHFAEAAPYSLHTFAPGLTPYSAPGAFSLLAATELTDGVWYPLGGFQGVRDSLRGIAEELGVCIRTGARVAAIDTATGGAGGGGGGDGGSLIATGVTLEGGERLAADVVVANRCGAVVGWGGGWIRLCIVCSELFTLADCRLVTVFRFFFRH